MLAAKAILYNVDTTQLLEELIHITQETLLEK